MKLFVQERMLIPNLLPEKGNIIDMTVKRDIVKKVELTQEELTELKLEVKQAANTDNVYYTWDREKDVGIDVELTKKELELLQKQVKTLDDAGEITDQLFDLCVKITDEKLE